MKEKENERFIVTGDSYAEGKPLSSPFVRLTQAQIEAMGMEPVDLREEDVRRSESES